MGALLTRFVARFQAPPVDSSKTWPDPLLVNAAAAKLGPDLYAAFCQSIGQQAEPWKGLHPAVKRAWVNRAERAIRSIR